jgi:hypothetical protein
MNLPAKLREIHPVILFNFGLAAVFLLATVFAGDAFMALRQEEEGFIEHVSHLALLVALFFWAVAARSLRGSGRARALAWGVFAYVALLLVEEIDWGLVYGVDIGFKRVFGLTSFHQTTWRNDYVWQDKLYWFGAPMALFFLAPWLGKMVASFHPAAATRRDSVAFAVVLATFLVIDSLHSHAISTFQAAMYAVLAWVGARAAGYRFAQPPSARAPNQSVPAS